MALEFICSHTIESGKRIILPRGANTYKLDLGDDKIYFYYDNQGIKGVELHTWKLDPNAREMDFRFDQIKTGEYITFSRFYDCKGNLLKIGNR